MIDERRVISNELDIVNSIVSDMAVKQGSAAFAELVDELEVIRMHTEQNNLRKHCDEVLAAAYWKLG